MFEVGVFFGGLSLRSLRFCFEEFFTAQNFQKRNYIFPLHSQKVVTYFGQISPNSTSLIIRGVRTGRTSLNNSWFLDNGVFWFGGKFKLENNFELLEEPLIVLALVWEEVHILAKVQPNFSELSLKLRHFVWGFGRFVVCKNTNWGSRSLKLEFAKVLSLEFFVRLNTTSAHL